MKIRLISTGSDIGLSVEGKDAFGVYCDISMVLGNQIDVVGNKIKVNPLFEKTSSAQSALEKLCVQYASTELWQLYSHIGRIPIGHHFFLVPTDTDLSEDKIVHLKLWLMAKDGGQSFQNLKESFDNYRNGILRYYEVVACCRANDLTNKIGNIDKSQRVCRLCGKDISDGASFSKKAHAISELLGNKSLVLCDECDECNGGIVNKMEQSVTAYFKALRPMLGVRGKSGIPSYSHDGLEIRNDGSRHVDIKVLKSAADVVKLEDGGLRATFTVDCGKYVPQDVYRMLAKYAISVLPERFFDLTSFATTKAWILGTNNYKQTLPLVAVTIDGQQNPQNPQIVVYRRQPGCSAGMPLYLVDFYAVANRFMFELPFMEQEHKLLTKENWKKLFAEIPSFGTYENWRYDDFNRDEEIQLSNNIVLEAKSQKPDQSATP